MSSFESWRAVRPSSPMLIGQDPPAEAFKNAVNAFGDPSKTYMASDPVPRTRKLKVPLVYRPAATVN